MAASSRGMSLCLLLASRPGPLCATATTTQPLLSRRLFSSLSLLRYAAKPSRTTAIPSNLTRSAVSKPPPPPPPKSPLPSTNPATATTSPGGGTAGSAYALATHFAQRPQPTVLYEAASHLWMKLSAWSAATMFYSYAGINYYFTLLNPPPDLAFWVPHAFAFICVATAGFGSYFLFNARNIVKLIRAVPTASLVKSAAAGGGGSKTGKAAADVLPLGVTSAKATPIVLEITCERILPGTPKKLLVAPEQVRIPGRIYRPFIAPTPAMERAAARQQKVQAKADWEYDKNHLMTTPIRHASKGFKAVWYGVRRAITKEGFMRMEAGGDKLKLDVFTGWALDDGRAIDRLVKVGA
ncbi:hypothetical protein BDP55DRAFT_259026 [Colletotrichum godetiae]|uniref:Uncharacterized protein n=1 Tax=Colletotrichum godetiae TaxID=1209918 RepID=A0AAJ0B000_9PEZI|nr:uncharacterized protein BDP55DRAFT_259026 [Colletotrichum godetiae]KAK1691249.1 hypothetical protein BDP55DRAFT_259026 [Colletotrichum godetiae]